MTRTEKDFFKIITGYDYEDLTNPSNPYFGKQGVIQLAKDCAKKDEEGLRKAFDKGAEHEYAIYFCSTDMDKINKTSFTEYLKTIREQ